MRKIKKLSKAMMIMLGLSLMVGCGNNEEVATTQATTQEQTSEATTEEITEEVASEEATSEEKYEIYNAYEAGQNGEVADSTHEGPIITSEEMYWEYNGASVTYWDLIVNEEWMTYGGGTYRYIKDNNTGITMFVNSSLWTDPNEFATSFDSQNWYKELTYCERVNENKIDLHSYYGGYLLIYDLTKASIQDDGSMSEYYQEMLVNCRDEWFTTTKEDLIETLNNGFSFYLTDEGDYDEVETYSDGTQTRTISVSSTIFQPKGRRHVGYLQITLSPDSEKSYLVWYSEPYTSSESAHPWESAQMCIESVKYPCEQ